MKDTKKINLKSLSDQDIFYLTSAVDEEIQKRIIKLLYKNNRNYWEFKSNNYPEVSCFDWECNTLDIQIVSMYITKDPEETCLNFIDKKGIAYPANDIIGSIWDIYKILKDEIEDETV